MEKYKMENKERRTKMSETETVCFQEHIQATKEGALCVGLCVAGKGRHYNLQDRGVHMAQWLCVNITLWTHIH